VNANSAGLQRFVLVIGSSANLMVPGAEVNTDTRIFSAPLAANYVFNFNILPISWRHGGAHRSLLRMKFFALNWHRFPPSSEWVASIIHRQLKRVQPEFLQMRVEN
jgi:hypothetical protein